MRLNSNIRIHENLHYYEINQSNGNTQTFTFPRNKDGRFPFLYTHGSQIQSDLTIVLGIFDNTSTTGFIVKIYGDAAVNIKNATITSKADNSWSAGFIIY